jgi:hypothetical protein
MLASWLDPITADQWKKLLETLVGIFQGRTRGGGTMAVVQQRFFGYPDAEKLWDLDKSIGTGQCVALTTKYVKEIGSPYRSPGQAGPRVKDMALGSILKGSVIANFWNGTQVMTATFESRCS